MKSNLKRSLILIFIVIMVIIGIAFFNKSQVFVRNDKSYKENIQKDDKVDNNKIDIKDSQDNDNDNDNNDDNNSDDKDASIKTSIEEHPKTNDVVETPTSSNKVIPTPIPTNSNSETSKTEEKPIPTPTTTPKPTAKPTVSTSPTPTLKPTPTQIPVAPSPTNTKTPVKTQEDINNELRKQIKIKYNVSVGYKDEIDGNYSNIYANPTKIYDDTEIYNHLVKINSALSKYPSSFFTEIKNKWKQVTIYLVKNINGSAAGLTDNRNPNTVIILINTGGILFESTLHHEIMHYIDCYLSNIIGSQALENSMMQFNPQGFTYGNQNNDYVYRFNNPYYFLSAYAKSNYKEDRAVIFEDMMFRSLKKEYYTKENPINEKAKIISQQLNTYFDCVSDNITEHWERFIAW